MKIEFLSIDDYLINLNKTGSFAPGYGLEFVKGQAQFGSSYDLISTIRYDIELVDDKWVSNGVGKEIETYGDSEQFLKSFFASGWWHIKCKVIDGREYLYCKDLKGFMGDYKLLFMVSLDPTRTLCTIREFILKYKLSTNGVKNMKTDKKITAQAFKTWFESYMEFKNYDEQIAELELIVTNNDANYYNYFLSSRRIAAHSVAFYSVILAIKPFLEKGYYASNSQIKNLILKYFKRDFKEYLSPLVKILEE